MKLIEFFADEQNLWRKAFNSFIYSEFGPNDDNLEPRELANFINLKFNLPHNLCHAISCKLDARQYEVIMEQLFYVKNSVLAQCLLTFQDFDVNHDGYI